MPMALSTNIPVSLPLMVSISPPAMVCPGFIPAIFRAAWLAIAAWPSIRVNITGLTGNSESSFALLGNCFTFHSFWSQPRPMIQPSVLRRAKALYRIYNFVPALGAFQVYLLQAHAIFIKMGVGINKTGINCFATGINHFAGFIFFSRVSACQRLLFCRLLPQRHRR